MSLAIGVERDELHGGQGFVLPADAIQREEKTYKEIIMPAKVNPEISKDDLVPITEFEEFAQVCEQKGKVMG